MDTVRINGAEIPLYTCHTVVVGAGAAGLNCADELKKAGIDVLLTAPSLKAGTSLNAGSDKQTFFKLSVAGSGADSPAVLAKTYMAGGAMHGDTAYALAAGSARAFFKLVELGVPFPQNELGEFVGYRTDHDESLRATSAGPLTSRYMAESLLKSCRARGVRVLEGYSLSKIIQGPSGRFAGLVLMNEEDIALVSARDCVLATGGPAGAYAGTVYPRSQSGATGAASAAGVSMSNLCYWQYGLASVDVLWNVSGSYQQAIPSYRDEKGEKFLSGFDSEGDRLDSIFRKGYQWPFDSRKLSGSSRVDRAVLALSARGGRAYLDFRSEESEDVLNAIGDEARSYLANCSALRPGPYERLNAINSAAAAFYADRGIDLSKEPLCIKVCAQHCNGGIAVDRWWRTDMEGLFAAGECAGVFGMYRPGGSALNETQVGSLRAAQYIIARDADKGPENAESFVRIAEKAAAAEYDFHAAATRGGMSALVGYARAARERMDICAGAVRDISGMRSLLRETDIMLSGGCMASDGVKSTAAEALAARNDLYVMRDILSSMLCQAELTGDAGHAFTEDIKRENKAEKASDNAVVTKNGFSHAERTRPLPEGGGWFETVWKDFREGNIIGR